MKSLSLKYKLSLCIRICWGGIYIKLLNRLKSDAQKKNITNRAVALKLRVSEGMVSNYYSGTNRIGGSKLSELVTFIYEDENKKIEPTILKYCKNTDKSEHIIEILEWCHHTGRKSLQKKVLLLCKKSENILVLYYLLFSKRSDRKISPTNFYLELEHIKYQSNRTSEKTGEFKVLGLIGLIYAHYDLQNYNMFFLATEALKELEFIKNKYLKEAFKMRVYQLQAVGLFKDNKLDQAKDAAEKLISIKNAHMYPVELSNCLILLSEIYVFDDYKKSLSFINKAINLFDTATDKQHLKLKIQLEATHDFVKIVNGDFTELFLTDPAEEAHYLASLGDYENKQESLRILDNIEKENGHLSSFQHYYKALAMNDPKTMNDVIERFINNGDKYYVNLPKRAL